jgi:hypothetical protein
MAQTALSERDNFDENYLSSESLISDSDNPGKLK